MAGAVRSCYEGLSLRRSARGLGDRLDRPLGTGHLQHFGADRRFRTIQDLDGQPSHGRHSYSDPDAGLVVRCSIGRISRVRVSVGGGGATGGSRIADLDAIRVAALANNAPVSYGALGAPIIALAAVTGLPMLQLSGSVGAVVAVLALLPPWVLLYLVTDWTGVKEAWPLAIVASFSYIAGQWPVARYLGPYMPDLSGAILSFWALFFFIKVWRPKTIRLFGGKLQTAAELKAADQPLSVSEVFRMDAIYRLADRGGSVDWSVVAPTDEVTLHGFGTRNQFHHSQARSICLQFQSAQRRHLYFRFLVGDPVVVASQLDMLEASVCADLPPDVGRLPGCSLHLRPGLCVRIQWNGVFAGLWNVEDRVGFRSVVADPGMDRRSFVG